MSDSTEHQPCIEEIGYILVPGYALMSFAAATEPFRAANALAGRTIYRLRYFGEEKRTASSSGLIVETELLSEAHSRLSVAFVCAGGKPADWDRPAIHDTMRRLDRAGVRLGGISGGPYLLAAAGLLRSRAFTIHWEHAAAFIEAFPELQPRRARFVLDRDRVTCGGGVAPLDMNNALIGERMGPDFAQRVSDWFLHTEIGRAADPQRASIVERYNVHHPALVTILETMEQAIESPLSRRAMAALVGLSERQIDRLFQRHRGTTFTSEYRDIRLTRADELLHQSVMSISEIAYATGFSGSAHFSRAYRAKFGHSPSEVRRRVASP